MDSEELIAQTNRIIESVRAAERKESDASFHGANAEAREFLRVYAGPKSSFLETAKSADRYSSSYGAELTVSALKAFILYIQAGLNQEVSPERRAQLDVVSDFLEQAQQMLEGKGVHPAAPAVLIGATLEEFLRTWVEAESISLGNKKPSLDTYAKALREENLISKQDIKDITSWAGVRNHASHGEWEEVKDKQRITLMLEGVNLFMRRYVN